MPHAVVVDDNVSFLKFVTFSLAKHSYRVTPLSTGSNVLAQLRSEETHVVLLDRFLPDADGFALCKTIKDAFPNLPIIMFSTAGEAKDVIDGLTIGADDYLPKPFPPDMLMAKIQAVCRRYQKTQADLPENLVVGPLEVRRTVRQVWLEGQPLQLTKSEYRILELLAERPGVVLGREEILHQAFGYPEDADHLASNLGFHMTAIRKKLGAHRDLIETARGFGFRLVSPPSDS